MKHIMLKAYAALAIALSLYGVQASESAWVLGVARQASLFTAITATTIAYPETRSFFLNKMGLPKTLTINELSKNPLRAHLELEKHIGIKSGLFKAIIQGSLAVAFYGAALNFFEKNSPIVCASYGILGTVFGLRAILGYREGSRWKNYQPSAKAPEIMNHLQARVRQNLPSPFRPRSRNLKACLLK